MAIISAEKKFCFIHIHRTGGSTLRHLLAQEVKNMEYYNPLHCTLQYVIDRRPEVTDYFKFSYVRNPYDLLVSLYSFLNKQAINPDHTYVKSLSFHEFVVWLHDVGFKREESDKEPFYRTQYDCLMINGNMGVDTIYKYETLCNDTATSSINSLFNRLEIDTPKHIPLLKKSDRPIVWNDSYDSKTYKLVNNMFKKDFKTFKYSIHEF